MRFSSTVSIGLVCAVAGFCALPGVSLAGKKPLPIDPATGEPYRFTLEQATSQSKDALAIACHLSLGVAHNAAFGAALASPPLTVTGEAFNFSAWVLNFGLKACPPELQAPSDLEFDPPAGTCSQRIQRGALAGRADNILGVQLSVKPDSGEWGPDSRPQVFAWNTDVEIKTQFRINGEVETPPDLGDGYRLFPTGLHQEKFEAESLATFWDYLYVPGLPFPKGAEKIIGKGGVRFAQAALDVGIEAGLIAGDLTLDTFAFLDTPTGSKSTQVREIAVLDKVPPTATVTQSTFTIEALELGGASVRGITPQGGSNLDLLRTGFTVEDDCDPNPTLTGPTPLFWPIGETTEVTWVASDRGPNEDREPNRTTVTQSVQVVDTLPPTVLAAPSLVVETDGSTATVPLEPPRVFDFGDAQPLIELEGQTPPESLELPLGQNVLEWTATDGFGNSDSAFQLINVKATGTNNPPNAESRSASARTFTPQEIFINGSDPDQDPLSFRIDQFPPNGGFEAPLLPYFIEDFRGNFVPDGGCDPDRPWERLASVEHVLITDEGLSYVIDCHGDVNRMVVFDEDRNVIAGRVLPRNSSFENGIYLVPAGNIILYAGQNGADGIQLFLLEPETLETIRLYRPKDPLGEFSGLISFLVNEENIMFLPNGRGHIAAFDLNEAIDQGAHWELPEPFARFQIDPGETSGGGSAIARDMALNHDNEIIIVTERRVHKMSATPRDQKGRPVIGEMLGWIGACASGEGCDPLRQASRGFSCRTGLTCQTGEALYTGSGPGQFDQSKSASIDSRNNIYIADWGNNRVQRFTDDGVFGGEAVSVCPPEQRCFLLGDFGKPSSVAVNSRNLFVFDKATSVIHVFETSVIEPIDETTGRLVYTANDGFQGTDQFTFSAGDGLARSASATVSVNVSRQFRAPIADALFLEGPEDTPLPVLLSAQDPDGALDLPLSYEVLTQPAIGTLSGSPPELIYTPPEHWYGETEFTFRAADDRFNSEPKTVLINITPVNDPPVLKFVSLDHDDPGTGQLDITAGFEAAFRFEYTDVDDVDLHRFDVTWNGSNGGDDTETDVVNLTEDRLSPLIIAGPGGGAIVARHLYRSAFGSERVTACVTDNVVVDGDAKNATETSLESCVTLTLTELPRPALALDIVAAKVIPGQYTEASISGQISNLLPEGGAPQTFAEDLEITLIVNGEKYFSDPINLSPGNIWGVNHFEDIAALAEGDIISLELTATTSNGTVFGATRGRSEIIIGPPADIVVTASEGEESYCASCSANSSSCGLTGRFLACTLSDALRLARELPSEGGVPTLLVDPGTLFLDESTAPIPITEGVNILGTGADRTAISGNGKYPFFNVSGAGVRISDIALNAGTTDGINSQQNGTARHGTIEATPGSRLELEGVSLSGHVGQNLLRSAGDLRLSRVSMEGNSMEDHLVEVASGITLLDRVSLLNNDIDNDDTLGMVGNRGGNVLLDHVTAVGNNAPVLFSEGGGSTDIKDSVLDGSGDVVCRGPGGFALQGTNALSENAGCGTAELVLQPGDLGPQVTAGGQVLRLPGKNGRLVDGGTAFCNGPDQLGLARPLKGQESAVQGRCDLGAVERLPPPLLSSVTFDARFAGDGFYLVADETNLSVAFFGYDSRGDVMWLVGTGSVDNLQPRLGGDLVLDLLESGDQGSFLDPQNPGGAVPLEPWGKLTLSFDDCNRGTAVLDGVHGSKLMQLNPLVTQGSCRLEDGFSTSPGPELEAPNLSTVLFDQSASGDGFYLVDNGRNISLAFFGYDSAGEPQWLVGTVARDSLNLALGEELVFPLQEGGERGSFDNPQEPGSDPLESWGTLTLTFNTCQQATAVLSGQDGNKTMNLSSLLATDQCGL